MGKNVIQEFLKGRCVCFNWLNAEPTRFWYDEKDNSYHTSCGVIMPLHYKQNELMQSLYDLEDNIRKWYKENKGIELKSMYCF